MVPPPAAEVQAASTGASYPQSLGGEWSGREGAFSRVEGGAVGSRIQGWGFWETLSFSLD